MQTRRIFPTIQLAKYRVSKNMNTSCVFVLVLQIFLVNCGDSYDNVYRDLPPIFHIDDYEDCKAEGNYFCKASVILMPISENCTSHYWKLIERSLDDTRAYNHNELFHAICANKFCQNQFKENSSLQNIVSECYKQKYSNLSLTAEVTDLICSKKDSVYEPGIIDILWLSIMLIYLLFVVFATYWDYGRKRHHDRNVTHQSELGGEYLIAFSVISNWKKFKTVNTNPDFQKLRCMQGIRFYNMLLIIFCHTYSSYIGGYVLNTDYIENIPKNPMKLVLRNLMVFLVQTYFLFSAFLLSYHFFQIMDKTVFSMKIIILTFLNRYLRIIPPVLFMVGTGSTIWLVSFFYGPIKDLYADLELQRCQKNWWTSLLFINNHYNQHDMCFFTTWYLAADTQLYVVSLFLLSLIWLFKKNTKAILASSVLIGILIPIVITYVYDLDIIYRITPENSKNNKFRSFNFNAIYSSSYANMATYMLGLCFGYQYFKHSNTTNFRNLRSQIAWVVLFIGMPVLVIIISSYYYTRFLSAILSGILKPLYATGIAIGILGMSQNIGGFAKKICEWKPALVMGNITYSTYVTHYGIVFYRTATAKHPLYISDSVLVTSFIYDAILSFFCGFLVHILLEMPSSQMQNKFILQVRKQRIQGEKNE
ncbi:unnamed protein product [Phaedon cochleariae]|uniref:Acyltransferase 3 domain-containing protein n=1 Tax=Phaedon cochleariae TaxID=80249 RepID=A0A9P0GTD2_PHACE|nr:unnamed protein product [Phaedon cochleariae]